MALPELRYVVTEIQGQSITLAAEKSSRPPGLSCMVLDRHQNYRLLATWRTEDRPRRGRSYVRAQAEAHCARLNGAA